MEVVMERAGGSVKGVDAMTADAFSALYRDQHARLVAYARRRLGSRELAEDCAAEVFRIAWERAAGGPGAKAVPDPDWLFAAARNVVLHQWRSVDRATELARAVAASLDRGRGSGDGPEHPASRGPSLDERLVDALETLPAEQRELLIARYWDGLTNAEAA
ncbi:MAG: sigma-70 family RNA polymerase sigma factor, partial [Bifidobacteriaceae bacterium]|nr:sigma-70 family RNA polymerase sigma factor [Bifidobacteriaceae bacterium]